MKSIVTVFTLFLLSTLTFALPTNTDNTTIVERQLCVPSGSCTRLEGNGDPHQWILHRQTTPNEVCPVEQCWVGQFSGSSGPETTFKSHHNTDWIDGGFDVLEELTITGQDHTCFGPQSQVSCIWANIWHTDVSSFRLLAAV